MKKLVKLFLVYFPALLICGQVLVNMLSFVDFGLYVKLSFYLNLAFGTNILFAMFLLSYTMYFKFCSISRWAAGGELAFAVNYLIIQKDNLYNIMFQVIVGILVLAITFGTYLNKFPNCKVAWWVRYIKIGLRFHKYVIKELSCKKGLERWEREKNLTIKNNLTHAKLNSH